ncbi:extensin family protein [Plesiocystis pacifica]|uniref:extensin-like domain-containing protein n=1 Tax=Plesiocystis pacifica TaxID=191768 RepID=UPI0012FCDB02|nr:extensin family protein [Plesiocystis pacifica]
MALLLSTFPSWLPAALGLLDVVDPEVMRPPDPIVACHERLENSGVEFRKSRIPLHPNKSGDFTCGAPQVVRYERGPGDISYGGSPQMACPLALAMAEWELILQEEAQAHLGSRVKRIKHVGTYNCRMMAAYEGWISEHSYANGIDIKSFTLADGRVVPIKDTYFEDTPEGQFLRAMSKRAYEEVFNVVVTPATPDGLHEMHLHFDMAHYTFDGS